LRHDSLTAVFGVLIEEPFAEERAIRAALDIVRLVSAMNARWQSQGRKPFQVGIGLNSGRIIAGDTGYQQRREFSLVGNDVQVAVRLQEATEEMNASVIASSATFRPVSEVFVGVPMKSIPLRGMKKLTQAFIVRGVAKRTLADEDTLKLPSETQFRRTEIESKPPPPSTPPIAPRVAAVPPTAPVPAAAVPDFVNATPPRQAAPEKYFSSYDDEKAAMPEPPPANQTYEDDSGPPLRLGP